MIKLLYIILILLTSVISQSKPYPLEYFAMRAVISDVTLSPDGNQLALLKIPSKEGNPVLEIYQSNNLKKDPFRVNAEPMEIVGYSWISNDDVLLSMRQKVRDKIEGWNQGVYEGKLAKLNLKTKKIKEFKEINARIANILPDKPNKVILVFNADAGSSSKVQPVYRPSKYYELDLRKGTKKLLIQGKTELGIIRFDAHGNPRIGYGFDLKSGENVYYYRGVGDKKWQEIHRFSEESFESFSIQGIDQQKPDTLIVAAHNGKDKTGIWEYDTKNKSFGELIYQRSDVDVAGVRYHSNGLANPDTIVGIRYITDKPHYEYFDAVEAQLYKQLEQSIPFSHNVAISSRSKDGKKLVVYNSGPQDPGTYYLLNDGKLKEIGSKQPLIDKKDLAEVQYIKYKSRDGKIIPAYITIPKGKGPFPTVVMPHGGPYIQEVVGYDEWGQMLANNGYLVLQPQYRGSRGYGLDFYQSAFINGGQGGFKMQDDKDDGVKYLINKGLTDPERVAMYGWSYGGYAALVAASRQDQLYQCVIAGAAVTDTVLQINYYRDRARGSVKVEQEKTWLESISPIKEVPKINIPLLLIHGSVDQRVPLEHAKRYLETLDKHNKNYQYVELGGADHFSNTLFFNHQEKLYSSIIKYLSQDCGPNGL